MHGHQTAGAAAEDVHSRLTLRFRRAAASGSALQTAEALADIGSALRSAEAHCRHWKRTADGVAAIESALQPVEAHCTHRASGSALQTAEAHCKHDNSGLSSKKIIFITFN